MIFLCISAAEGLSVTSEALASFQRDHSIQMHPDEIETISRAIKEARIDTMVEWGTGASTIKWLQDMRDDQRLIAIEHNRQWSDLVRAALASSEQLACRARYYLCEPNGYWKHGYGNVAEENPVGLDRYFAPDSEVFDADIFLVDGVARGVCLSMIRSFARKRDPVIFLHDWHSRQPWYSWAVQLFPKSELVGATLLRLWK